MSNLKDHKTIGQELELFFTNEIAPGAPFWLPKGMVIFKELEKFIRELTLAADYQETSTPMMVKSEIFKQSGHWTKFGENNMYNLSLWETEEIEEIQKIVNKITLASDVQNEILKSAIPYTLKINYHGEEIEVRIMNPVRTPDGLVFSMSLPINYTLKPMNCPESTILYRFRPRSYKELPLRFSEIGRLHRREKSGEVNGLLRVRQLTMDDAHIFAREDQIENEVENILDTMVKFYESFGLEYEFKLATRPEERAGNDKDWDKAEKILENVLKRKKLKYSQKDKDGAFYGPKIDLHIKDAQKREWQLATVQLDFHQPQAFDLKYVNEKGEQKRPVMVHRAIFGSFERFIAILTEHYQGAFPVWLSPIQVQVLPITDNNIDYSQKIVEKLNQAGLRTEVNIKNETLQAKIRGAALLKIPYILIIGNKEEESKKVAVRIRGGKDLGLMTIEDFISQIEKDIKEKK